MTPLDLITQALKKTGVVGVGQTPQAEDVNDAFLDLNMMLGQWNRKRWLVYHLVDRYATATGASAYRIGPGLDIDVPGRVTQIESAYWRLSGGTTAPDFDADFSSDFGPQIATAPGTVDVPLSVISSREEFSRITFKGIQGFPSAVWLDADAAYGLLYVWPAPTVGEIHVLVQDTLSAFPDQTTDISLPAEYAEALLYNLSARLRPSYGKAPDPTMTALAKAALNTIKVANAQISTLKIDPTLTRWGRFGGGGFGAVALLGSGPAQPIPLPLLPATNSDRTITGTDPAVILPSDGIVLLNGPAVAILPTTPASRFAVLLKDAGSVAANGSVTIAASDGVTIDGQLTLQFTRVGQAATLTFLAGRGWIIT